MRRKRDKMKMVDEMMKLPDEQPDAEELLDEKEQGVGGKEGRDVMKWNEDELGFKEEVEGDEDELEEEVMGDENELEEEEVMGDEDELEEEKVMGGEG
ncbi:hypothetical protein GPALN_014704 [Globodera pallida]|nr:hypothetical protein GPALN_014704 [Globodera pallida]